MTLIFLVFALVLFILAATPYPPLQAYAIRLIAAGLAFWIATLIPGLLR